METGDLLSARLRKLTQHDEVDSGFGISRSSEGQTDEQDSDHLRTVVEQQFMRMNDAHDRIRSEMLCVDSNGRK
jgi:hypothetical protein